MPNELHNSVFDFLERLRSKFPDFTYWLRERNVKGRLENGYWFQGQDEYAFVGLYDRSGGSNMSRSFGLVFYHKGDRIGCQVENVFNEERDKNILSLYQEIRNLIGGFEKHRETKYLKYLSEEDGFNEAEKFLVNVKPKIDALIQKRHLEELFIDKKSFERKLQRILNKRESQTPFSDNKTFMKNSLNQILFGPPGTGKTYNTVIEAVKIVDSTFYQAHFENRDKIQTRFNELLIKEWENTTGQIAFCTFHQSFSYEDFVEGIKPYSTDDKKVYYEIEDGIFKSICRHAEATNNAQSIASQNLVSISQSEFNRAVFYKISLGDTSKAEGTDVYNYCINNNVITIGFGEGIDLTGKNEELVNEAINVHIHGPYAAQALNYFKNYLQIGNYVVVSNGNHYIRALGKVTGEYKFSPDAEIGWDHFREVEWIFKDVEIPVSEFYRKNLSQQTIYKLKKEYIIPEFFVKSEAVAMAPVERKNFVIIIDEINRGNVSSIFGELITLIEPTKRAGRPEALEVLLPYSKKRFTVPENLYIIGTMNTADRGIEALDTALRRRFSFIEKSTDYTLLQDLIVQNYFNLLENLYGHDWDSPEWSSYENDFLKLLLDASKYTDISEKEWNNPKYISRDAKNKSEWLIEDCIRFFNDKNIACLDLELMLRAINVRIEKLLDKDHVIGHSYFLSLITSDKPHADLIHIFQDKVIPLLEEYFFGDFGKIGLVLGDSFVLKNDEEMRFAKFTGYDPQIQQDLAVRPVYKIKSPVNWNFFSIYSDSK